MSRIDAETKPDGSESVDPARGEAAARGDGKAGAGTNERLSGTNFGRESDERRRVSLIYGAIALITFAVTTMNALSQQADIARFSGRTIEAWKPFVWEWTSGLTIVALAPLVRRLVLWTLANRPLVLKIAAHVVGAAGFLFAHIAGLVVLRKAIYAMASAEPYVYAFSTSNILYEARKDAILYALLAVVFYAARRLGLDQPSKIVAVAQGDQIPRELWLRDGSTNVRVDPADIVSVASAGNYIEYGMADGAKHLIRGTLQAEEERLARFGLVRVHRTRLVNAKRLRRVTTLSSGGFEAEMDTGEIIAGSRSYRDRVSVLVTR
ncbi:LytTr DNA-binding domain protein [Variibacter gotjawalensis]|uniref:LytTr DNA-binding domain protein n=1 Tax=Variibacter gotjawalensis TaxID=1333996 RepID=A0A0S3PPZ8_9BRAD|nr:LytTR family DNA-binding domain-containing protein [Variibacter gotjawalensis]NIK48306.1 DNA-binding LytR/AlgR family response regulator [Variibacter gotjawalensis]RZS50178.1 LytTR family transcriptional regulator [Variibacter gotjawalensis]BAT58008.1 LytTr DNA-binding domain protein [Variibacter gotjawalensis]